MARYDTYWLWALGVPASMKVIEEKKLPKF